MKQVLLHLHILCRLKKENYCSGRLSIVSLVKEEGRVSTQILAAPKIILTHVSLLFPWSLLGKHRYLTWETSTGKNVSLASCHCISDCRPSRLQGMGERWAKECSKNPDYVRYKQQKLSLADLSRERLFIVSQNCPGSRKSGSKDRWKHSPEHPATPEGTLPPVGAACWAPQLPLLLLPLQTGGCCCSHHQNNSSLSWV